MIRNIKKLLLYLFLVSLVFLLGFFLRNKFIKYIFSEKQSISKDVLGLPSEEKKETDIIFNDYLTRVNWYGVDNIENLSLTANFGKYTSLEFMEKEKCRFLSSGGYYKSDYSPTGLLISQYKEVTPFVFSTLANGTFSVNDFATPRITLQVPRDPLKIALQAGPLLKENGEFKNLSLKRDEKARRVVVGVTGENKAFFLILYNPDSVLMGPYLKDLPKILEQFEKETGIVLADALNLDGGTPTVFITESINLTESTLVGSFFCVK